MKNLPREIDDDDPQDRQKTEKGRSGAIKTVPSWRTNRGMPYPTGNLGHQGSHK